MNIKKIAANMSIKPTDRKIKKAKQMAEHSGVLPKEMPIEKKFFLEPNSDSFERIKDKIQVSIDQMKR